MFSSLCRLQLMQRSDSLMSRFEIARRVLDHRWVKCALWAWGGIAAYDTALSQIIPPSWSERSPKVGRMATGRAKRRCGGACYIIPEYSPMRHWRFEPVEELSRRIDLVVMLAFRKDRHLVKVFGEPGSLFWDMDKAVFDHRGLRVQAHDLVAFRLVAGDRMEPVGDQILDQLGARGLVLDQHDVGGEQAVLFAHGTLQCRVFEPLAQQVEQKEILASDPPGRADTEVAELGRLVGGVPALDDAVEALRPFVLTVALEPLHLDQTAAQGGGRLLILAGEIVFANSPANALEGLERLAL